MNTIIPNTFQHPNYYVDVLDEYLTPEESKVLTHAIREILGWRDSLQTRQKHIARDVFLNGRVVKGKKVYGGVNLCKEAIERALDALHQFRILVKSGSPRDPRGQLYELTEDVSQIDIEGLQARKTGKKAANKSRVQNNPSNKKQARLSDRPVVYSPITQASSSPVVQASKSPMTQASSSPVGQAERNPVKETHNEKPIERERAENLSENHAEKTDSLSLSSSPSGNIYLLFFRDESKRLNQHQIKAICSITDTALFQSAIEYLLKSGVQELWKKIPLMEKKMQELAAAASVQPGAGGAASPAHPGALLKADGNPVAFTPRAKQRQANISYLNNLLLSPADVVIDAQPLAAIAGA